MHTTLLLSANFRSTAGVLLLTLVAVEYGGWFMPRVVRGRQPVTAFQQVFFRSGHAHAGVLVILALVGVRSSLMRRVFSAHWTSSLDQE